MVRKEEKEAAHFEMYLEKTSPLNRLHQDNYTERTKKRLMIIAFVAISAIALFIISSLWFSNAQQPNAVKSAETVKPEVKSAPVIATAISPKQNEVAKSKPTTHARHLTKAAIKENNNQPDKALAVARAVIADTSKTEADTADAEATPLDEMVVMDYTAKKKNDLKESAAKASAAVQGNFSDNKNINTNEDGFAGIHPQTGWSSFKNYLKENALSPDGKKGVVKLSVIVLANGTISDVKVIKSVSPATDKKAVELINNGPAWISDSKAETVKVKVQFDK